MILRLRFILLRLLLLPILILFILTLLAIPFLEEIGASGIWKGRIDHPWRFIQIPGEMPPPNGIVILCLLLIIIVPVLSDFILDYYFRNSSATEILLYRLFLMLIPLHAVRVFSLGVASGHFPVFMTIVASRADLLIHLMVILILFAAGLQAVGIPSSRLKLALTIAVIIAMGFAASFPMDETIMTGSLTHLLANEAPLSLFCLFTELATLANFGFAWYRKGSRSTLFMLIAVFFSLVGYELLYHFHLPGVIGGLALILGGTFIHSREVYNIYRW